MSIDEVHLKDSYFTVITNKDAHGGSGALAAIIRGTSNKVVSEALSKVPVSIRFQVKEITLDFAGNMDWICRDNFMNAVRVGDRFHAQKLVTDSVQELRVELRRAAIDEENQAREEIRKLAQQEKQTTRYKPPTYANGDTKKQLLARSRYLLFKPSDKWTASQQERAAILFHEYPQLETAYNQYSAFRDIYEKKYQKEQTRKELHRWIQETKTTGIEQLVSAANSVSAHEDLILNYFPDGQTNASAESFNAKLKGLASLLRGIITNFSFFLFRVCKLYA